MLTERIMHECVKKLENLEEEEIESLCKLLTTVGALLDTQKVHAHMDVYFSRMKKLTKSPNVNSRMQFMLQVRIFRHEHWALLTNICRISPSLGSANGYPATWRLRLPHSLFMKLYVQCNWYAILPLTILQAVKNQEKV